VPPERQPKATCGGHFSLRNSLRALTKRPSKSWTLRSVADAKRSATRNSSGASCYQAPSWLVDDNFYLGSASNAVKWNGSGTRESLSLRRLLSGLGRWDPLPVHRERLPAYAGLFRPCGLGSGALPPERIRGVETGGCPHTAIHEDASINLAAVAEMSRLFPGLDLILIESGGDNLAATFSPELADLTIYVIDVAAGDKIPRKGGPGITRSDLW